MQHVVILGGSIAGLTAARVLRRAGFQVTIVEPDGIPCGTRSGVPQSGQLHALLDMGRIQIDRWFPGLTSDLVADGAVLGTSGEIQMFASGVRKVSVPGNELIGVTRGLLESHIRRRALDDDQVTLVRGRVCGLVFASARVSGVQYRAADSVQVRVLAADAVVDAMGRSSRLAAWLNANGWQAPRLERMRIDLGYATALFHRSGELPGLKVAHAIPAPPMTTAEQADIGALAAVEGGRWMVLIAAFDANKPSQDRVEFLDRMRRIEAAPFGLIAERCEMLTDVETYRMAHSQRRAFAALKRLPGGLFAVGDAVASFNPIYGQGMTSAALHASCLAAYLGRDPDLHAPAREYFERVAVVVNAAWDVSTLADLAQPHVTGPYPPGYRVKKKLAELVNQASVTDPLVNQRFLDVVNMRRHPSALKSLPFLWRVGQTLMVRGGP